MPLFARDASGLLLVSHNVSFLLLWLCPATSVGTGAPEPTKPPLPAEEVRLNTAAFRAGLKKRGLIELLELHTSDFPPASDLERQLMKREIKLAEFADKSRSLAERQSAIHQANSILEKLVASSQDDSRRFEWRLTLARSLVYDESDPYLTNMLYRVAGDADRTAVLANTVRAVRSLRALLDDLSVEFERIESLPVFAFEQLETSGFVEQLDRVRPQAEYLLLWVLLYDGYARDERDPRRSASLHEIVDYLSKNRVLLDTPHDASRIQVQALVLAGIAHRLLNNHRPAGDFFDRAIDTALGIEAPAELRRVDWAVVLGQLERVRNAAQRGQFDAALKYLGRFRGSLTANEDVAFDRGVMLDLLERDVLRLQARAALRAGRKAEAGVLLGRSWEPLAKLAEARPQRRAELYAILFGAMARDVDPEELDPLEQCAYIAGVLTDADQQPDRAPELLSQAIRVARRFLDTAANKAPTLVPEVMFNLGVALFRQGMPRKAAREFLSLARNHQQYSRALQAAGLAVQLSAELYGQAERHDGSEIAPLYRESLETLLNNYPKSDDAAYWRFHYAQLLDESARYVDAAAQYALVDPSHVHNLESLFFRTRCVSLELQRRRETGEIKIAPKQVDALLELQRAFQAAASEELLGRLDAERAARVTELVARSVILVGEVEVLPQVARPNRALERLTGFEVAFPNLKALAGRLWRTRLVALQQLGRMDEATEAIPAYLAADPRDAGATLQGLFGRLTDEIDLLKSRGEAAKEKGAMALLLAEQIHQWSVNPKSKMNTANRRAVTVQLAEANLRTGRYERARTLFESLVGDVDDGAAAGMSDDVRILLGYAEAQYQLGNTEAALPWFNRLATGLSPTDQIRWRALLRDLQCRTALDGDPIGIIKVIDQQERLHPELGGSMLASQFKKLRRDNVRRRDEGP